ncbi:hypothetical protein LG293_17835 (plasmid) [Citricoccus nitrophenolicus]
MTDLIQLAIVSVVALVMGRYLINMVRKNELRQDWVRVMRSIRWWMVPVLIVALATTLVTMTILLQVPGLGWGWWSALGGESNVVLGQTASATASPVGFALKALGVAVPAIVLVLVPLLALGEERTFRSGTGHYPWWRVLASSMGFGLAHLVVGIPVAAGLALTIAGVAFHLVYRTARARHLAGLQASRPERVLALANTIDSEAEREFEVQFIGLRDELSADRHAVFIAAGFHTLWNLTVIGVLVVAILSALIS